MHTFQFSVPTLDDALNKLNKVTDQVVKAATENPVTDAVGKVKERINAPTEDQLVIIALQKQNRALKGQVTRLKNILAEYE
jgi:hypothetical protein